MTAAARRRLHRHLTKGGYVLVEAVGDFERWTTPARSGAEFDPAVGARYLKAGKLTRVRTPRDEPIYRWRTETERAAARAAMAQAVEEARS